MSKTSKQDTNEGEPTPAPRRSACPKVTSTTKMAPAMKTTKTAKTAKTTKTTKTAKTAKTMKTAKTAKTAVNGRLHNSATTRCSTYYLPGAQKRKKMDEPEEQANKRLHTDEAGVQDEGHDNSEAPGGPTSSMEQGELIYGRKLY